MMNEAAVKAFLCAVRKPPKDFTVVLTHKSSARIHGLYKPSESAIHINDRNFTRDSDLLYTAVHEYAHHLLFCAKESIKHNREFWCLFHDLLDVAEKKELIEQPPITKKIKEIEDSIKDLLRQEVTIQRSIAEKIIELQKEISIAGAEHMEYYVERRLQLPHLGQRSYLKTHDGSQGLTEKQYLNPDAMRTAARGPEAELALQDGRTIVQAQTAVMKPREELPPYESLKRERTQIEGKIEKLEDRHKIVEGRIKQMELQFDRPAAERRIAG